MTPREEYKILSEVRKQNIDPIDLYHSATEMAKMIGTSAQKLSMSLSIARTHCLENNEVAYLGNDAHSQNVRPSYTITAFLKIKKIYEQWKKLTDIHKDQYVVNDMLVDWVKENVKRNFTEADYFTISEDEYFG